MAPDGQCQVPLFNELFIELEGKASLVKKIKTLSIAKQNPFDF